MGDGSYVRVIGELSDRYDDQATVYISKIEKATPPAPDYSSMQELTPAGLVGAAKKLVFISGYLETPSLFGNVSYYYPIKIKGTIFPDGTYLNANIKIGSGNSQMEPLRDNFMPNDIRIRDLKGNLLAPEKKVKVIGIFELNGAGDGGSISVEQIIVQN